MSKVSTATKENESNFIDFDLMTPTISTLIAKFDGDIDYNFLFFFFEVSSFDVKMTKKGNTSLPTTGTQGNTPSLRLEKNGVKYYRGYLPSKPPFKNALTMDLYTSAKLINAKISKMKIQMCGTKTRTDAEEVVDIARRKIEVALKRHRTLSSDIDGIKTLVKTILESTKGEPVIRSHIIPDKKKEYIPEHDHSVVPFKIKCNTASEKLLMKMIKESSFVYYNDLCNFCEGLIENLPKNPQVNLGNLKEINSAMVNYNYKIGRRINYQELKQKLEKPWEVINDPDKKVFTRVTLPYKSEKIRKKKQSEHTFMVYATGSTTQSGPGGLLSKEAYLMFMEALSVPQKFRIEYEVKSSKRNIFKI